MTGQDAPQPVSAGRLITAVVVIVITLWIAWHPLHAQLTKGSPPAACQLWGGTWNIWSGWQCA